MAFVSARTIDYQNLNLPDGTPIGIGITGEIVDDAFPLPYVGTCWIQGENFANLPATVPELENTEQDPRFQAIMGYVAAFVVRAHTEWTQAALNSPVAVSRPSEEVAMLPVLTELPGE